MFEYCSADGLLHVFRCFCLCWRGTLNSQTMYTRFRRYLFALACTREQHIGMFVYMSSPAVPLLLF